MIGKARRREGAQGGQFSRLLIDNGEVIATEQDTTVLNTFFSNAVTNLKIPEYAEYDRIANNVSNPILKVIVRYRNHSNILTIGEACKKSHKLSFSFSQVGKKEILEEIQRLDIKKRLRNRIFPLELLKKTQTYSVSTLSSLNDAIDKSYFPTALKQANVTAVFKTGERYSKDQYTHQYTSKCVKNI